MEKLTSENRFFILALVLAVTSRLVVHQWNVTLALAAPIAFTLMFPKNTLKSFSLVILSMLMTDAIIGFHSGMAWVYGAMILALVPAVSASRDALLKAPLKTSLPTSATYGFLGSLIFFIVSNFSVWLESSMYSKNLQGLLECYVMGIPFFKTQLFADTLATSVLFTAFSLVKNSQLFSSKRTALK